MSVLKGLSTRDYSQVACQLLDSFGLSASSISRHFIEHSTQAVEAFTNRSLEEEHYIALFIDGKHLAGEQMIIVLGITAEGIKKPLDVIQSTTENSRCIKEMLGSLVSRGLAFEQGLLVVTDGSKGIHKAVEDTLDTMRCCNAASGTSGRMWSPTSKKRAAADEKGLTAGLQPFGVCHCQSSPGKDSSGVEVAQCARSQQSAGRAGTNSDYSALRLA